MTRVKLALLHSLLAGLRTHLKPGGKTYLAYGCVGAIRHAQGLVPKLGLHLRRLDTRDPNDLPDVFLPGMLLETTVP